ncbi:MAG: hypothetical protein J6X02_04270 [Bacilli bacterium]|nr:hypothetical protein [Bacilli bacterium]
MKIIFLDIDGVLNTFQTFREIHYEFQLTGLRRVAIDEDKVALLKEIVDNTGALIVLSSSWRKYGKMKKGNFVTKNQNLSDIINILKKYNLNIYDITPRSLMDNREQEIRAWLSKHHDVESFIVIDNESADLLSFINYELVKTSFMKLDKNGLESKELSGLTKAHVNEAISKLNNKSLIKMR